MSEKCPFCGAEMDHMGCCMEGHPHGKETPVYKCGAFLDTNGDYVRPSECYEAELTQLRGLLGEAVKNITELKDLINSPGARLQTNDLPSEIKACGILARLGNFLAKAKMKDTH